jgi:hypothetical protein
MDVDAEQRNALADRGHRGACAQSSSRLRELPARSADPADLATTARTVKVRAMTGRSDVVLPLVGRGQKDVTPPVEPR